MKRKTPGWIVSCCLLGGLLFFLLFSRAFGTFNLIILSPNTNNVTLTWPATGSYTLLTNGSLLGNWGAYGGIISSNNGTNSVTLPRLATCEFFRLRSLAPSGIASPTNISGMAYFWNFNDLPPNSQINSWTDEVGKLVMTYNNGGAGNHVAPVTTNAFPGLDIPPYGDYIAFTNNLVLVSSNFTFWVVMRPFLDLASASEGIFGNANVSGINLAANTLGANWGNGQQDSSLVLNYLDAGQFPYGQTYDLLDSGGTIYSNGVPMATGIGQPANNFQLSAIGSINSNNGFSAKGYIQYLGIWTNHLLTATDATNLDYWYWNYGITNVTNGLIAWWKLNDGSGAIAADSWGTNTMYFGGTGNAWTNGIAGNGALYFNGNGWLTNLSTNFADNLPGMTVSFWLKETGLGGDNTIGSIIEKGVLAGFYQGDPGWAIQGDGTSNIYFGAYEVEPNYVETPHNSAAPDYPIVGDNNWHFIVGEYTNAASAGIAPYLYIDGAQITGGVTYGGNTTNISAPTSPIIIGAEDTGSTNSGSPAGSVEDVRIYNRELSLPEIEDLYKWRGQP